MFEIPESKRVRREELFGSDDALSVDGDGNGDAELRARLKQQVEKSLGLDLNDVSAPRRLQARIPSVEKGQHRTASQHCGSEASEDEAVAYQGTAAQTDDEEDGYEFRLFNTSEAATKVTIKDDEEFTGDGAILSRRPEGFYLVTSIPAKLKEEYAFAAVSGDEVRNRSLQKYWGLDLPWKVRHITATRSSRAKDQQSGSWRMEETGDADRRAQLDGKRKRPGKKKRVRMRVSQRAKEDKAKTVAERAAEKEEHLKDKKKRMNRLKKLRRRAKDKEKRAGENLGETKSDSGHSE